MQRVHRCQIPKTVNEAFLKIVDERQNKTTILVSPTFREKPFEQGRLAGSRTRNDKLFAACRLKYPICSLPKLSFDIRVFRLPWSLLAHAARLTWTPTSPPTCVASCVVKNAVSASQTEGVRRPS